LVRRAVRRVIPPGPVADALHGTWLGHPLHPALTDVPVGAWVGAAVLDAVPDQEAAATALVGLGLAAAVPSAVTGYNDWAAAGRGAAGSGDVGAGGAEGTHRRRPGGGAPAVRGDELGQLGRVLQPAGFVDVHHVAGGEVAEPDVAAQFLRQAEVGDGVRDG